MFYVPTATLSSQGSDHHPQLLPHPHNTGPLQHFLQVLGPQEGGSMLLLWVVPDLAPWGKNWLPGGLPQASSPGLVQGGTSVAIPLAWKTVPCFLLVMSPSSSCPSSRANMPTKKKVNAQVTLFLGSLGHENLYIISVHGGATTLLPKSLNIHSSYKY